MLAYIPYMDPMGMGLSGSHFPLNQSIDLCETWCSETWVPREVVKMYSGGGHRPDSDTFHVTIIHSGFIVDLPIENDDFMGFTIWLFVT